MKIKRFREVQIESFDDFFNKATDTGMCEYCDLFNECVDYMGLENVMSMSGNGCSAFDSSIENLKKHFLLEKCSKISISHN